MLVKNLAPYESVEGKYVVKFKKPVQSYAKGYTFQLRIGDASGEIMLRYWGGSNKDDIQKLYDSIKKDDVVRITGETTMFNNRVAVNINPPRGKIEVLKKGDYEVSEFIPESSRDPKEMYAELTRVVDSMKDVHLKKLVESFTKDKPFSDKFIKHPGAMYKHHGWLGGLLEHTLNVVKICDFLKTIHPKLNRDLMLTGAILHDVGKIRELDVTTHIQTSREGMLIGHLALSYEEVSKKMDELGTPEDLKLKIKHIIISHHGKTEYGTPKQPGIPEALAVYLADETDSKLTEMIQHIKNAVTEDDYIYIRDFGLIYLK